MIRDWKWAHFSRQSRRFGFCVLLGFAAPGAMQGEPILLEGLPGPLPLHEKIEVLVDASGRLSAGEVAALDPSRFQNGFDRPPRFDGGDAPIWFRLRLENRARAHDWVLDFNRPRLDRIEAFVMTPAGPRLFAQAGWKTPAFLNSYPHQDNVIRIDLDENLSRDYLFRIENPQTRLAMAFQIFTEQSFIHWDRLESTILGVYFGILFTMVIINSFFFIALRDRAFLLYALFLFFFGFLMLHSRGLDRQIFASLGGVDLHMQYYLFCHFTMVLGVYFLTEFFQVRRHGFSDRLLRITLIVLGAHAVFALLAGLTGFVDYPRRTLLLALLLLPLPIFSLVFSRLRRGEVMAVYVLIGTGLLMTGVFVQIFQVRGNIAYNAFTANATVIGSGFDMILISLGLADRFRRLERQSERHRLASETKSRFLAHMSHEIRTPLNAVLGMSELLHESPLTAEQTKYLNVLTRSGRFLLGTINDILDISKIEAGRLGLESIRFRPRQVLESLRDAMVPEAAGRGIDFVLEIDPDTPSQVRGDPTRLRQVLNNLLSNAIKFTEEGSVAVRARPLPRQGDKVQLRFEVEDTGIGITRDQRERIFESFTQADDSTTRKYGGTGLGLAISRQAVELMGGRIGVESVSPRGSRFFFSLPFEPVPETEMEAGETTETGADTTAPDFPSSQRDPLSILLAEDNEDNRMLFLAFLKRTAYRIDIAENGAEAVEKFQKNRYDVVFMDIQMPVLSGLEAVRQIRSFESTRLQQGSGEAGNGGRTPIFALTAHAFDHERIASREAGCDGHISKPLEKGTLMQILSRLETSK